jgi:hypothetical protein
MCRPLAIVFGVVLIAAAAFAQSPGHLGIYSNPGGSDCNLYDEFPQTFMAYVVHANTPAAQASRFKVVIPSCMVGAFLLEEVTGWPIKIGLVEEGTLVGYGACLSSPIHVMTLHIFGQGMTSDCCIFPVLPDPTSDTGEIEVQLCDGTWVPATGTPAVVNPDPGCYCIIPVGESTWGKIKSLYAD